MALAQAKRSVAAVFIKTKVDGADVYVREPYNIVTLDFQTGQAPKVYLEPAGIALKQPSQGDAHSAADTALQTTIYNELRSYDRPPFPKSRIGASVI